MSSSLKLCRLVAACMSAGLLLYGSAQRDLAICNCMTGPGKLQVTRQGQAVGPRGGSQSGCIPAEGNFGFCDRIDPWLDHPPQSRERGWRVDHQEVPLNGKHRIFPATCACRACSPTMLEMGINRQSPMRLGLKSIAEYTPVAQGSARLTRAGRCEPCGGPGLCTQSRGSRWPTPTATPPPASSGSPAKQRRTGGNLQQARRACKLCALYLSPGRQ